MQNVKVVLLFLPSSSYGCQCPCLSIKTTGLLFFLVCFSEVSDFPYWECITIIMNRNIRRSDPLISKVLSSSSMELFLPLQTQGLAMCFTLAPPLPHVYESRINGSCPSCNTPIVAKLSNRSWHLKADSCVGRPFPHTKHPLNVSVINLECT